MHDHELELAAAAIDFELTPAEQLRLDKAIAECSVCATAAAGYRRQSMLLESLPVIDASPSVRLEVERAAGLRGPRTSSWTWALLAAALLAAIVGSVAAVGAINQFQQQRRLAEIAPTPTVQPSTPAQPTPTPEPSADVVELDPPSGDLANVGPPLAYDGTAVVVTTNLRIRSAPFVGETSIKFRRYLQPGDRMVVLDGPVIGQNYEWYLVAVWRPSAPALSWPVGWVARAGHDGEVWFQATSVSCPASPISIEALATLAPVDRLACYHDTPIEVRAVIGSAAVDCDQAHEGCPTGPDWLATGTLRASISAAVEGATPSVPIALDPASGLTADTLQAAGVVKLRGAFDANAASTCAPDPARAGPDGPLTPIEAMLRCRTEFVVTGMTAETFPAVTDTKGRTVSDRLRVRSLPETSDASIKYEPLLPLGTKVTVLDGPVLGSGYAWYHVTAPITDGHGNITKTLTGWVAAAGLDGEPWLEVDVPSSGG
jgi:hypothetical protein